MNAGVKRDYAVILIASALMNYTAEQWDGTHHRATQLRQILADIKELVNACSDDEKIKKSIGAKADRAFHAVNVAFKGNELALEIDWFVAGLMLEYFGFNPKKYENLDTPIKEFMTKWQPFLLEISNWIDDNADDECAERLGFSQNVIWKCIENIN